MQIGGAAKSGEEAMQRHEGTAARRVPAGARRDRTQGEAKAARKAKRDFLL